MKKIEIPTGNSTIDWLLENERNGLSEMNADQAVRFLIDKQNEIIEVINTLQASTDKSKLLLADVGISLDLRELERKLDEALGKETRETLTEWLKQQRQ